MDSYGRKNALLLSVAPLIAGWSSIALAQSHEMILLGRIVCGIAVGLMSAPAQVSSSGVNENENLNERKLLQILLAEISQANLRGKALIPSAPSGWKDERNSLNGEKKFN